MKTLKGEVYWAMSLISTLAQVVLPWFSLSSRRPSTVYESLVCASMTSRIDCVSPILPSACGAWGTPFSRIWAASATAAASAADCNSRLVVAA